MALAIFGISAIKHFNTAGPNTKALHYQLDPLVRIDSPAVEDLVAQSRYFVLHAPRQTGKTTCLLALQDYFNSGEQYRALYLNLEPAQSARNNVGAAAETILSSLAERERFVLRTTVIEDARERLLARGAHASVKSAFSLLAESSDRPLILFLDEVDALVGDTLISLLRQIRAGYTDRPQFFPHSIVLCGVRDIRDYRMTSSDGEIITGGSAFNIKAESLRLGNFSRAELLSMYAQHTDATGQSFSPEAIEVAWLATQGQPWLVNALAEQAVWKTAANLDRTVVIDETRMRDAREALILRNDSHLDQLVDKLKEPRVRSVIEPMLNGELLSASDSFAVSPVWRDSDRQYLIDLGLIRMDHDGLRPANGIYAEVLPRVLASIAQASMHSDMIRSSWKGADGKMQPKQFLENFFAFWREHGEAMMKAVPYHEAAPTLVLMAYLQRVVNGAGRIEREYAAGAGRMDLMVVHGDVRMVIEVKVWRDTRSNPEKEGQAQIEPYLRRHGVSTGYLVIFDQRSNAPDWAERMHTKELLTASGLKVLVFRG